MAASDVDVVQMAAQRNQDEKVLLLQRLAEKIQRQGYDEAGVGKCHIFKGRRRPSDGYCYISYIMMYISEY